MRKDDEIKISSSRGVPSLYDKSGQRKYLNAEERKRFKAKAAKASDEIFAFCWVLHETGCRISEALELTPERIDLSGGMIVFESLKKRRDGVFRAVPVSEALLGQLTDTFSLASPESGTDTPLWGWSRMTAYRYVKQVMDEAGIEGVQATAKGLRHGFAIAAIEAGIPLNLVQRWLGHADLATTAIYADAVGGEERKIARKLWK